jgi:hypothetical protein
MSKRKKKATRPPIRGLTVAGGVLDEAYSDPDIEFAVAEAVAVDPVSDLTTQAGISGYATEAGGLSQFIPVTWEKPEKPEPDPIADIQASVDYIRNSYSRSVTMKFGVNDNGQPVDTSGLLELLMNQSRSGRATILPNDRESQFVYDETPPTPEPDDGLRRPEMK